MSLSVSPEKSHEQRDFSIEGSLAMQEAEGRTVQLKHGEE